MISIYITQVYPGGTTESETCARMCVLSLCDSLVSLPTFIFFFTCHLSCLVTVEALYHSGGSGLASSPAVIFLNLCRGSRFPSDPFL